MKPEDLLHTVYASGPAPQWQATLEALQQARHVRAEALPTPMQRVQAHRQNFQDFDAAFNVLTTEAGLYQLVGVGLSYFLPEIPEGKAGPVQPWISHAQVVDLMERPVQLIKEGCALNNALRSEVRAQYHERVQRQDRANRLCGTYPYRQAEYGAVHVVSAAPWSNPSRSGTRYAYDTVKPFLRVELTEDERASLYHARLRVQIITTADLQHRGERSLLGQRGVFTRAHVPAGTCLGVYGGQILDPDETFLVEDHDYIMSASEEPGRVCVNGETMMSLVNTLFAYHENGDITGHAETGYNVEEAAFPVRMADGRQMLAYALFASTDIAPRTELRLCYDLARINDGQSAFQPADAAHHDAELQAA